jgi:hypothetical protein
MKFLFALLAVALCHEMLVTKEYTDYLKRHVSWEVVDYEENIFRGWTVEEAKVLLGFQEGEDYNFEVYEPSVPAPAAIDWEGANCELEVRNQGNCGSCWAFATTNMLSSRCCLMTSDHGWLAPQELVSCDKKSQGCGGGWCTWALDYVKSVHGMVPEKCYPYLARNNPCPTKCVDGSDWKKAHVCDCVGAYKIINTEALIKAGLATGPVTLAFGVCRSFMNYKNGYYKCDCNGQYVGLHAVTGVGFGNTPAPENKCYYKVKNSWGTGWGIQGYFMIYCDQCGMSGTYPNGNVLCEKVQ